VVLEVGGPVILWAHRIVGSWAYGMGVSRAEDGTVVLWDCGPTIEI